MLRPPASFPYETYRVHVRDGDPVAKERYDAGRKERFGRFVKRATDQTLKVHHDWKIQEFCEHVGVSKATLYRWINGTWKRDPEPESVEGFCRALGIDPNTAFEMLGWGVGAPTREATPPASDPDIEALARKLQQPGLPSTEEAHIRDMIRYLVGRPVPPTSGDPRKRSSG